MTIAFARWKLVAGGLLPLVAALILVLSLMHHRAGQPMASRAAVLTGVVDDQRRDPVDNPDSPAAYPLAAPANARAVVLQALQDAAEADAPAAQVAEAPGQEPALTAVAPASGGGWVRSAALNGTGGPLPGSTTWGPGDASVQTATAASPPVTPRTATPPAQAVIVWPANGSITSLYGPSHPLGIDIGLSFGTPLRAAASGRVSFVGGDPCCSYGYYVDIDHGNGVMTRYGHLIQPSFLRIGDAVRIGDTIGYAGSTGNSTGPHLHFEVRLHGMPVNPLLVLP